MHFPIVGAHRHGQGGRDPPSAMTVCAFAEKRFTNKTGTETPAADASMAAANQRRQHRYQDIMLESFVIGHDS